MRNEKWLKILLITVSHILVAAIAVSVTLLMQPDKTTKLDTLQSLIEQRYIGEFDQTVLDDAAAAAMVDALPDRWSYYISAGQYASHMENKKNANI